MIKESSLPDFIDSAKVGVLIGSFISAIIGYLILMMDSKKVHAQTNND